MTAVQLTVYTTGIEILFCNVNSCRLSDAKK